MGPHGNKQFRAMSALVMSSFCCMVPGETLTEFQHQEDSSLVVALRPNGDEHVTMLVESNKHLLRREKDYEKQEINTVPHDGDVLVSQSKNATVKAHLQTKRAPSFASTAYELPLQFGSATNGDADDSPEKNHWQILSSGDAQALTIHDGMIYIVAHEEKLFLLEKGIYSQPLNRMTPYSNWTLIGWGAMSSIAVHDSAQGKIMYGVGTNSALYRQNLATMRDSNVWEMASVFPLKSIAIDGDTIYGTSPAHPSEVFKIDCNVFAHPNGKFHGWFMVTNGPIKSFSVFGDFIFAIMENNKIYNKSLSVHHASSNHTELQTFEDFWTLKNNANMLSIAVVGDTIYGVSKSYKVCRTPVVVNEKWAPAAAGSMVSLAINANGDTIYGAGEDGNVYKQDLLTMSPGTSWEKVSSPDVSSIAIQGETIYGVSTDLRLYKHHFDALTADTSWERASACCVTQVAIADGIVYAIGADLKVYSQNDILMTPESQWVLVADGPWKFITTREDSMYGIDPEGVTHIQSLSYLTTTRKQWTRTSIEDEDRSYPAKDYSCITAHNDVMYACGPDKVVYSKLIDRYISYPPGLQRHGNTYDQAFQWNLTNVWKSPSLGPPGVETTPLFRETTTLSHEAQDLPSEIANAANTASNSSDRIYADGKEPGLSKRYVDTFRDENATAVYGSARRGTHFDVLALLVSSLVLLLSS